MKKSRIATFIVTAMVSIFGLSLIPATTHAAVSVCDHPDGVSEEVLKANGCNGEGSSEDITNLVIGILNGVVGVLGVVAAIFIIVGGVNYMTSAGDSGKVQKAKNTILYATIGLVIAVLSFAIVNFVISNIISGDDGSGDSDSSETDNPNDDVNSGGGPITNGGGAN